MDDSHDDIARVEDRIEALAEAIERCRKISFAARIAIGAGAIWLALTLLGLVTFVPYLAVASLAAVIGGVVLLGSNATTWAQHQESLRDSEAMRAGMIGNLEMRVVEERRLLH